MEIGKIEKYDPNSIKITAPRSPLSIKVLSLEVNEGFVVSGIEDSFSFNGSVRTTAHDAGRKVSVRKLAPNKYQVVRTK